MGAQIIAAIAVLAAAPVFAQISAKAFDAASIKPNRSGDNGSSWHTRTGSVDLRNQTLRSLVQIAYRLKDYQVTGGPLWADADRFDIIARAPGPADDPELIDMMKTLLADRFQLAFHKESKQFPGYDLMVTRKGFKLTAVEDAGNHSTNSKGGHLKATRISMPRFAEWITRVVGQPVEDKTGVQGVFTFEMDWSPANSQPPRPDTEFADAGPSIFTALQEQLGLRLEARKVSGEILVIDRAERPSEN